MTDYENNLMKKIEEKRRQLESIRKSKQEQRDAEKEEKAITNPNFSMHKLGRLILSADENFYMAPLHSYDLAWDMLVHTHKVKSNGKDKLAHTICTDQFEDGSCELCKTYEKLLESNSKNAWEFNSRHVKAMVMYIYNTIGSKRTFTGESGDQVTYYLNPVQVVEIPADGKGKDCILSLFETYDQDSMFISKIWAVRRKAGTKDARGITRGGGYEPAKTVKEDQLLEALGKEGISAALPEYTKQWVDKIKGTYKSSKTKAKDEVLRYILTSFDNGEQIAKYMKVELPQKDVKDEKNANDLLKA